MSKKDTLFYILILAAVLRLWGLSSGDTVSDEVFMGFRGIGMIDFDEAAVQTTPWEWWHEDRPWWTNLSMHDHPWGVPLVQNISMRIFGENNFGMRFPSALLGIGSVYLLYKIGFLLYTQEIGLIAAGLLAVTLNGVYISRLGLQESYAIFAILLGIHYFLKSLRDPKYLVWAGAIIGIGAEFKYNVLILAPMFIFYLVIFRRDYFRSKYLWQGILAALIFFSPTLIYNFELYRAVGHFDFQFSHIFGQRPDAWQVAPGKEIGDLGERIGNLLPRLINSNSWLFLSLFGFSFAGFLRQSVRGAKDVFLDNKFLIISFGSMVLLILMIGPSYRFLSMLAPFMALSIGVFLIGIFRHSNILQNVRMSDAATAAFSLFLFFEIFYSVNNQILSYPIGPNPWLASNVRYENYNWGYNELGGYLEKEFSGKMPAVTFDVRYKFLEDLRQKALDNGRAEGLSLYPALVVYEGNFDGGAKLWVLDRLHVYYAWPIISLQTYMDYLRDNGSDYLEKSGFKIIYFIQKTNWVAPDDLGILISGSERGIYNKRGDEVFKIYKTILP